MLKGDKMDTKKGVEINMENKTEIDIKCKKEVLNKIFNRAKPFVNEIALNITSKNVSACIVDNAHVALYECSIDKKNFDEYKISEDVTIGIDLTRIDIPLSLVDETMHITFLEEDGKIKINNYRHSLIDVTDMPIPKLPTLNPEVEITTDKIDLIKKLISVASKISDHIEFFVGKDKQLWIKAEGQIDDFSEPIGEITEKHKPVYPVIGLYSVDFMLNVLKDLKDKITISFSTNHPITVVEETETEKHVFIVAPRIMKE